MYCGCKEKRDWERELDARTGWKWKGDEAHRCIRNIPLTVWKRSLQTYIMLWVVLHRPHYQHHLEGYIPDKGVHERGSRHWNTDLRDRWTSWALVALWTTSFKQIHDLSRQVTRDLLSAAVLPPHSRELSAAKQLRLLRPHILHLHTSEQRRKISCISSSI
jgi:hypothetical protein